MKTVQYIQSQPPAWQWRWKQSPMPSAGLPQEVTVTPHMPSSWQIQWACYKKWKMEWEAQTGMCQCLTSDMKTPMDVLSWTCWNDGNWLSRQINHHKWLVSQKTEVMGGAWDITCTHKAWSRQVWNFFLLNNLPWKESGPSSIKWTLELFQWKCRGNFMGYSKHIDTSLNWTVKDIPKSTSSEWNKWFLLYGTVHSWWRKVLWKIRSNVVSGGSNQ